jgi:hypothetical protein
MSEIFPAIGEGGGTKGVIGTGIALIRLVAVEGNTHVIIDEGRWLSSFSPAAGTSAERREGELVPGFGRPLHYRPLGLFSIAIAFLGCRSYL